MFSQHKKMIFLLLAKYKKSNSGLSNRLIFRFLMADDHAILDQYSSSLKGDGGIIQIYGKKKVAICELKKKKCLTCL